MLTVQKTSTQGISAVQMLDSISLSVCSPAELCASQLADPVIGPMLRSKETEQKPQVPTADDLMYRRLAQLWNQLFVKGGVLYQVFVGQDDKCNHFQLLVPAKLREEVLETLHGGIARGHLGHEKTFSRIQERYYWSRYWSDTRDFYLACHECAT